MLPDFLGTTRCSEEHGMAVITGRRPDDEKQLLRHHRSAGVIEMIESSSLDEPWQCSFSTDDIEVITDTPADYGGTGAGFRPGELLEGALASCMNMEIRMTADRAGIDVESVTTRVDLDRSGDTETFRYAVEIEGVTPEDEARLKRVTTESNVYQSLDGDITFTQDPALGEE